MWAEIISAAALIAVAVIEAFASRERKAAKTDRERTERRAEVRARENRLSMRMMDANLELGLATAIAVEEHKLNGEMRRAKDKAQKAQAEYGSFIQEVAAGQVAKV